MGPHLKTTPSAHPVGKGRAIERLRLAPLEPQPLCRLAKPLRQ